MARSSLTKSRTYELLLKPPAAVPSTHEAIKKTPGSYMPRGVFYVVSSDEGEPQAAPRLVYRLASISVGGEGMLGGVALGHDLGRLRLALDGAGNGFLRGGVVIVLNLLVVLRIPMDEHADADEHVVGFRKRDHALGDAVRNRFG